MRTNMYGTTSMSVLRRGMSRRKWRMVAASLSHLLGVFKLPKSSTSILLIVTALSVSGAMS